MKTKTFYIARDRYSHKLLTRKPAFERDCPELLTNACDSNWVASFCYNDFRRVVGFKLEIGKYKKFKLVEVE